MAVVDGSSNLRNKATYNAFADVLRDDARRGLERATRDFFTSDADINVVQSINLVTGADGLVGALYEPMLRAFPDLYRRTDLLFGGTHEGQDWVTGSGHFVGTFANDWMGIPASGALTHLSRQLEHVNGRIPRV